MPFAAPARPRLAGRDLGSVLRLAGPDGRRLFGWYKHGARIAFEVSKALNYLHSKGIVHM